VLLELMLAFGLAATSVALFAPAAAHAYEVTTMRIGDSGPAVVAVQNALIAAGTPPRGGADGIFGTATAAAVEAFQIAKGLDPSGVVDETTAAALGIRPATSTPAITASAAPAAATAASTRPKLGDRTDAIEDLQSRLIAAGISVRGGADGIFGPATAAAVRAYQSMTGAPVTGVVDDATATALGLGASVASAPGGAPPVGTPPPAPAPAPAPARPKLGDRTPAVKALQTALLTAGIPVRGGADGIFGPATAAAVTALQTAKALPASGVVDDATASALGLGPTTVTPAAPVAPGTATSPRPATPPPAPVSTTPAASTVVLDAFPVQPKCWFGDTWQAARSGGRGHEGVDIGAAPGNAVYAVKRGTITKRIVDGALSGNAIYLTTDDKTYFFYAHLSGFAEGSEVGSKVTAGQLIGYVGKTGNAGSPHLHLEIHPLGGRAINPYPAVSAVNSCTAGGTGLS